MGPKNIIIISRLYFYIHFNNKASEVDQNQNKRRLYQI